MSALFDSPAKPSLPPPPPPPPTMQEKGEELDRAAQLQATKMQRGRAATLLTGGGGVQNPGATSKALFGQ